jgi:lipoate-protein ligase A
MRRAPWSIRVCFAGTGPGEVTLDGRKVVGISQRRTRQGALFQCAVIVSWDPAGLLDVLALEADERDAGAADLADVALGVGPAAATAAVAALAGSLP